MKIALTLSNLPQRAEMLRKERKRQKLSRLQTAAMCNVCPSFIRDVEMHPEGCSLGKLPEGVALDDILNAIVQVLAPPALWSKVRKDFLEAAGRYV